MNYLTLIVTTVYWGSMASYPQVKLITNIYISTCHPHYLGVSFPRSLLRHDSRLLTTKGERHAETTHIQILHPVRNRLRSHGSFVHPRPG
jgi:hypothetical protein